MEFCITTEKEATCEVFEIKEFPPVDLITNKVLGYFQTYLPIFLKSRKDVDNKPIIIDPKDIDIFYSSTDSDYRATLQLTEDNSSYPDSNRYVEQLELVFKLQLSVKGYDTRKIWKNLITFQGVVKSMLLAMDEQLGLEVEIEGFSFDGNYVLSGTQTYIREGTYNFIIRNENIREF